MPEPESPPASKPDVAPSDTPVDAPPAPAPPEPTPPEPSSDTPVEAPPAPAPTEPTSPPPSEPVVVSPSSESTPPPAEPVVAPAQAKKSHSWLLLLVLLLLIAIGLGVWYADKQHNTAKQATTSTKKDIPLLTYGFNNDPLNVFYPNPAVQNGLAPLQEQIFEGLVKFSNGTQIVPDLAASWTNPSDTTWIFKLKPNVYFHDGNTVTAQDVVYSWQQVNAQDQQLASYTTSTIKNVQAINNQTVEITTTAPDPVLLNRLTGLWIIDSKAKKGTQPWELGTGAYTVKPGTTPTANKIDLVAFNKWHGGHIYTRALDYVFYGSPAAETSALKAGKIDLADNLSNQEADELDASGFASYTPPSLYVDLVAFNTQETTSPTANPKIREAIDLTINPLAVLKAYGVAGTPIDQVVPPEVPGYNPKITRPAMNLTLAKELVKEAGYPNGVTINFGIGEPAEAAGQEIAKELKAVGITLNLEVATNEGTYFSDINSGAYQMFYEGNSSQIVDASDILVTWQDASYYNNPTFDSQLTKANETFNPAARLALLQQASKTLISDNAYVPLFQHSYIIASKKNIVYPVNVYDSDADTFFSNVYQK